MNIFDVINVPLGYLIKFCYMIVPNYAIALFLFAIIIKVIMFPLGIKQQKNTVKQAALKPKEMAIRKRYAGRTDKATQQKVQEEVMKLYQSENFNPMGGCLPLLLEMPILFALVNVVYNPLKYLSNFSAEIITAITEKITELGLTAGTQIQMIPVIKDNYASFSGILPDGFNIDTFPNFTMFGGALDLSQTPSITSPSLLLLIPIITFIAYFASAKITKKLTYTPPQTGDAGNSMKIMEFTMPLMSVFISFTVPSVIGVYWIFQCLVRIAQQFLLSKMYPYPKFTEEDYKQAEREMNGKLSKKEKKRISSGEKVRSLHRIDENEDEENSESDDESSESENIEKEEADTGLVKRAELKDESDKNNKKKEK